MSGFDNPTNHGRAEKIVGILEHLEKSARSNRTAPEEVAALLGPVFDQLGKMGIASAVVAAKLPLAETRSADPEPSPAPKTSPGHKPRMNLRDIVEEADLVDLCAIISICANRLDHASHELQKIEKEKLR